MLANLKSALKSLWTIDIDRLPKEGLEALPKTLGAFIWFFTKQIKGLLAVFGLLELIVAIALSLSYWYVGELVERENYSQAFLIMGAAILMTRYIGNLIIASLYGLIYMPRFGLKVARQLFYYTSKQSLGFFQDDFAGRIANKITQTSASLQTVLGTIIGVLWFTGIFLVVNVGVLLTAHWLIALPMILWLIGFVGSLAFYLPRIKQRAAQYGELASHTTGQLVDIFSNILPIKYFARTRREDKRMSAILKDYSDAKLAMGYKIYGLRVCLETLNMLLILGTALAGFYLIDTLGQQGLAAMAVGLPLASQVIAKSYWVMFESIFIFEDLGRVQEGMETLSKPLTMRDRADAKPLQITKSDATIEFDQVEFHYGSDHKNLIKGFSLTIPAGQKIGLVGKSGAGKSTIINLLARTHDLEDGSIRIGGQNIARITQDSLRQAMAVVTQDSYLFHRSIRDNILYGNPDASEADIIKAAQRAFAYDFIQSQQDNKDRKGLDAHVGERGVKLSGGQKQRINIARTMLKDAPILILDEATSALDSESEQQIQAALEAVMKDKTVIAIAHRLSTLKQMDRIIVMDQGRIIEDGTHQDLIKTPNGHYAALWDMQSGGFV